MARTIQHHVDPDAIAAIPPSIRNSGVAMKCLSGYGANWISTLSDRLSPGMIVVTVVLVIFGLARRTARSKAAL